MIDMIWLILVVYEKFVVEYEYFIIVGRCEVSQCIGEVCDYGDFCENVEYDVVKQDQGLMEVWIWKFCQILDSVEVCDVEDLGVVEVGMVVIVIDDDGDEFEFFVVFVENKVLGMILVLLQSLLGIVLFGVKFGDDVFYEVLGGIFIYCIVLVWVFDV